MLMMVKRKNWKFFLFTIINKQVKGDFSHVKKSERTHKKMREETGPLG